MRKLHFSDGTKMECLFVKAEPDRLKLVFERKISADTILSAFDSTRYDPGRLSRLEVLRWGGIGPDGAYQWNTEGVYEGFIQPAGITLDDPAEGHCTTVWLVRGSAEAMELEQIKKAIQEGLK